MAVGTIAVVAMVAATAASAYASYESGRQQKKAADYNASLANEQAANAREAARIKEETYRKQTTRHLASMRAAYGARGVSMEGTPLLALMDSAKEAELDALRIRRGGEMDSNAFEGEAGLYRMMGKQAYSAGLMGAGTSLLGGASSVSRYYAAKK